MCIHAVDGQACRSVPEAGQGYSAPALAPAVGDVCAARPCQAHAGAGSPALPASGAQRGRGGLRAAMGIPVGAGPEGCVSEFACEADGACVRLTVGGLGVQGWQGRGRAVRGGGPGRAWVAREARARG